METLTLDQIKSLAGQTQSPSISIFMPTHRVGQDTLQNPIRFKNLLREAHERLVEREMGLNEVEAFLQPAQTLLDDALFWQHQRDGLAVFIAPDDFHYYHLPFAVEELAVVAQSYYVKPILPLFTNNGHYYVLAISQDEVRLFEGTRYTIGQIDLPEETPDSLDEALESDDPEKQLQVHSGTSGGSVQGGGKRAGMFHGHGGGSEEQKEKIERYLNIVDASLRTFLDKEKAPLVLAGVDYLLPIYHKVSEYAHIMKEGIMGNAEHLKPEDLQAQAWKIVEPHFREDMEKAVGQYHQFASTDKATDKVREIIAASYYGRVDKLFLVADTQMWGKFDPETGKVLQHQVGQTTDDDLALLDFAAMQTLQKDGHVYMLSQDEMPTDLPVAAVLRY